VTNNSDHKIVLWKENAEDQGGFVYKITVRDSHSAVPPDTALGRLLKDREDPTRPVHFTRSGGPLDLRPGGAITDYLNVGKLYDLAPGTYVVEVMRPDQETKLNVKSNSVTVTITK
jgi:hypothetical protein